MRIEAICPVTETIRFFETSHPDCYERRLGYSSSEYLSVIDEKFYRIYPRYRDDESYSSGYQYKNLSSTGAAAWLLRANSKVSPRVADLLRAEIQELTLGCIELEFEDVSPREETPEDPAQKPEVDPNALLQEFARRNPKLKLEWLHSSRLLLNDYRNNCAKPEMVKRAKNWFNRDWDRVCSKTKLQWWKEFPDEIQTELHAIRREFLKIWGGGVHSKIPKEPVFKNMV